MKMCKCSSFVKNLKNFIILVFLSNYNVNVVKGLKDVKATVPQAARIMDTVTLQCTYDLEGEPLYTVKWYKGSKEFFRFIPKELPNTQVFPLPGVDVDLSKSNPNEVVLRHVQPEVTGRYKCEVSTDAPNFYTIMVSGYLFVIDIPEEDPVMFVETDLPEVGYTIRGNCTTPPSYPPANITWLINGKKVNESFYRHESDPNSITTATNVRRRPVITISGLEHEINVDTFQNGRARIECVVTVFNLYKRKSEKVLEEERPRPRPSSVLGTRDSASDIPVANIKLHSFLVILMIILYFSR